MQNSGPFSLTNQVPLTVPDPSASLGYSSDKVQIQNGSPFTVDVTANGQTYNLPDFTAQTIPLSGDGTAITILPSSGPAGTQGNVTVVWLLANEQAPIADGQLTGAAQYAVGLGEQLYQGASSVVGLPIPPTARTLIVALQAFVNGNWPSLEVRGSQSGLDYFNQPLYLKSAVNQNYLAAIPMAGIVDKDVDIVTTSTASFTMSVFADTAQYDESVFYNGVLQTASTGLGAAGSVAVLTGPARLLTAEIENVGATQAVLGIGGTNLLAATGTDARAMVTLPAGSILPAGQSLTLTQIGAGSANAQLGWAYP